MKRIVEILKIRVMSLGIVLAGMISAGIFMQSCSDEIENSSCIDSIIENMDLKKISNENFELLSFDTNEEMVDFLTSMEKRRISQDVGSFNIAVNEINSINGEKMFEILPNIINSDLIRLKSGGETTEYNHTSVPGGIFSTQHLYWQVLNNGYGNYSIVPGSVSYVVSGMPIGWSAGINHVDYLPNVNNHTVQFRITYDLCWGIGVGGQGFGSHEIWVYTYTHDCNTHTVYYSGYCSAYD
jgi:hypothetical protein